MLRLATRSLIPPPPLATHLTVQPGAARQSEELFCAPQRPEAPQFPHKHVSTATSPTRGTRATSKWPQVSPWQLAVKTAAGLGMDRGALRSLQRTARFTWGKHAFGITWGGHGTVSGSRHNVTSTVVVAHCTEEKLCHAVLSGSTGIRSVIACQPPSDPSQLPPATRLRVRGGTAARVSPV